MTAKERAVVEAARCVALDAQYGYTVSVHDAVVRGHVMEALRVALRDLDAEQPEQMIPASKVRALRDGYTETVGQGSYVPMACVQDALDALLREGGAK